MSKSVDQRIVEMRFENKDFESGARESLQTLKKLKNDLDGLGSGNAIELSKVDTEGMSVLSRAVDSAGQKFSWLKEVATGALREIGVDAYRAAKNILEGLTVDQLGAGWEKYSRETEAVQTLMAATRNLIGTAWADEAEQMAAVESELEKILWFTDETSYAYTDMISNIARFTSNGIGLEDATTSMIGIAGAASVAGVSVEKASSAMDVFSKAMGRGYFQLGEWRQLEQMNFVTQEFKQNLLDTAIAAGTVKKIGTDALTGLDLYDSTIKSVLNKKTGEGGFTVNNLQEGLTKGKFANKQVIQDVLNLYGSYAGKLYEIIDAHSDYYHTANELLSDVEAYKKGHLDLAKTFGVEGEELAELTEKFEWLSDSQNELAKTAFTTGQEAKTFAEAWASVGDAASSQWMSIFKTIFGGYTEARELWTDVANELNSVFVGPLYDLVEIFDTWGEMNGRAQLFEALGNIWEAFGNIASGFGEGFSKVFPVKTIEELGRGLTKLTIRFKHFTEGLKENEGFAKAASAIGTTLAVVIKVIGQSLKVINAIAVKPAIKILTVAFEVFARVVGWVFNLLNIGIKFFEGLAQKTDLLGRSMRYVNKAFDWALSLFPKLLDWVEEFVASIGETEGFKKFVDFLKNAWGGIKAFASQASNLAKGALAWLTEKYLQATLAIVNFVSNSEFLDKVVRAIGDAFGWLADSLPKVVDWFVALFSTVKNSESFQKFSIAVQNAWNGIKNFASSTAQKASDKIKSIKDRLSNTKIDASGLVKGLKAYISSAKEFISTNEKVQRIIQGFKTIFSKIGEGVIKAKDGVVGFFKAFKNSESFERLTTALSKLWDSISKFAGSVFTKAVDKISEFFSSSGDSGDGMASTASNIDKLVEAIAKIVEAMASFVEGSAEFVEGFDISDLPKKFKESIDEFFKNGISEENFNSFFKASKASLTRSAGSFGAEMGDEIMTQFSIGDKIIGALKNPLGTLKKEAGKVIGKFKDEILGDESFKIDWGLVLGIATVAGGWKLGGNIVKSLDKIAQGIKTLFGGLESLGEVPKAAVGALNSLKGVFQAYQADIKANILLKVAGAIAILVGTFILLTRFADFNKLEQAAYVMSGIGAAVAAFAGAFMLINASGIASNSKKLDKASLQLKTAITRFAKLAGIGIAAIGFGFALVTLVGSLFLINEYLKKDPQGTGFQALFVIAGTLVGSMVLLAKFAKEASGLGRTLFAFSLALLTLVGVTALFGLMDPNTLGQGGMAVVTFLLAMGMAMALISGSNASKFVVTMITTLAGLAALTYIIEKLASIKAEGINRFVVIAITLVGALGILAGVSAIAKKYDLTETIGQLTFVLIGFAATMALMAYAFSSIEGINTTALLVLFGGLAVMLVGLTAAAAVLKSKDASHELLALSGSLIAIAAAMGLMALGIRQLQGVDWTTLAAAAGILAVMMGGLVIAGKFLDVKAIAGMGALVVGLVGIAGAMYILLPIFQQLPAASSGLIVFGVALAALVALGFVAGAAALGLIVLSGAVVLLGLGALEVALAVQIFANALQILSVVFPAAANSFLVACDIMTLGSSRITSAIVSLIAGIVNGLIQSAPLVATAAMKMTSAALLGILEGLAEIVTVTIPAITECLNRITVGLYKNWEPLKTAVWNFIQSLGFVVKDALLSMVEEIPGADFLFGDWIKETKASIKSEWSAVAEGIEVGTDYG